MHEGLAGKQGVSAEGRKLGMSCVTPLQCAIQPVISDQVSLQARVPAEPSTQMWTLLTYL